MPFSFLEMKRKVHIRSSVFFWHSDNNALFYDTESSSHLLLPLTEETKKVCDNLEDPVSLYSFVYDDIQNPIVLEFVNALKSKGFCIEDDERKSYFSLPPILGINNNWEILKRNGKTREVLELLRTIVFFVGKPRLWEDINTFRRTDNEERTNELLDLNRLRQFLNINSLSQIRHLQFVIGEECSSLYLVELIQLLKEYHQEDKSAFFVVVDSINASILEILHQESGHISAIFTKPPYPKVSGFRDSVFIVQSKEELIAATKYIEGNSIQEYTLYPHYNGKNLHFLEEEYFPRIEDVIKERISKRLVFIHQTLNINYFGRLLVFPDGRVFSNPFEPPVGNLSEDLYSLICSEMDHNYLWRKTRSKHGKCGECLFRDLCPSPTIEEEFIPRKCPDYVK